MDFLKYFSESPKDIFDVNTIDSRQKTILHNACSNGDLGVVKALV